MRRSRDSYSMGTHKGIYGNEIGLQSGLAAKVLHPYALVHNLHLLTKTSKTAFFFYY